MRHKADYGVGESVEPDQAEQQIQRAEQFLDVVV